MADAELTQRLVGILVADAVGYSRLMALDERATVDALDAARVIYKAGIETHQEAGDSVLAVFPAAAGAVNAALAVQSALAACSGDIPVDRRLSFRIGLHLGDVYEKNDGTVYGDGLNTPDNLIVANQVSVHVALLILTQRHSGQPSP